MSLLAATSTSLRWHALPPLWVVVLVIVPAVVLSVRWFYRRESGKVGDRPRITMGILRVLAILLVLGVVFGPYTESITGEYFKRHLILCVDTSGSMANHDLYSTNQPLAERIVAEAGWPAGTDLSRKKRIEIVKGLLASRPDYIEELANKFRLHLYTFDGATAGRFEPREGEDPAEAATRFLKAVQRIDAKGSVTRIGTAIRELVMHFDAKNEPVAGIVLMTDGRHTGGAPGPIEAARHAGQNTTEGIPIYPVPIGDPAAAINIGVSRIDAPEVALAGDDVQFTVTVHARGFERGRMVQLEAAVLDAAGEVVEKLPIAAEPFALPGKDEPPVKVPFGHSFDRPGRYLLRIGVPPEAGEAVVSDNYQRHVLRVVQLKMRVLFVANKPSYTYRFLKEALFRAEGIIEANVLLMSAESEWPQEASRGTDEIRAFPRDMRSLSEFDVVILHDVDPDDRMLGNDADARDRTFRMIEEWVKRGGGLIMQAGRSYPPNIPDRYVNTPLMPLLPVVPYGDRVRQGWREEMVDLANPKRYKLTAQGIDHPIMRIRSDPRESREYWESDDSFNYLWYAPVERAKSSAVVLATRRDWNREAPREDPILALQDYGLGKVLWIATDELWKTRNGEDRENLYYWRFWSNAIRHLATYRLLGGNKRIKIWVDRADGRYQVGDSVGIEAKFLDENFEPVAPRDGDEESMKRTLKLRTPEGDELDVVVHAYLTDPPEGLFKTTIAAGRPGTYSLVAAPEGDEEPAETAFVVEETTLEMSDPLMDMHTLNGIQRESGGKLIQPDQFHHLDEIVPDAGIIRSGDPKRTDLWDRAWVLWLFVGLLAVEWILRRLHLLL